MATTEAIERARQTPPEPEPSAGFAFEIPADAHTLEGFLRWEDSSSFPQRGSIEFIAGRLFIDMAAGEIHSHETLKARVGIALGAIVSKDVGKLYIDNVRYASSAADTGVEPDLLVCLYESVRSGRLRFVESRRDAARCMVVEGAADLVVEIVSDASVRKDTQILRERFFVAGVREYWIFDARGMRMSFELLTRSESGWREAETDAEGFRRSEVLNRRVRVERIADAIGLPDYDVRIVE